MHLDLVLRLKSSTEIILVQQKMSTCFDIDILQLLTTNTFRTCCPFVWHFSWKRRKMCSSDKTLHWKRTIKLRTSTRKTVGLLLRKHS